MDVTSPRFMVYQALQYAISQDTALIMSAEAKLLEWEIEPGFYTTLLHIINDRSLDTNVRWMATVYFKNGIAKHWRMNVPNRINEDEKASIRLVLLSIFDEPVPQIAVQIAVLISKIARFDYPREWPDLVPQLMTGLQTTSGLEQQRVLLVLCYVIKAISSKRLLSDRKQFEDLTENIYTFIFNSWKSFTNIFFNSVRSEQSVEDVGSNLEKALLSVRILSKLTIYGFKKPHTNESCMSFINTIFPCLKESLECREHIKGSSSPYQELNQHLEKLIIKEMKILNEFIEYHLMSFTECIPIALEFSFKYVFSDGINLICENNIITFENFTINCINMVRAMIKNIKIDFLKNEGQWNDNETKQQTSIREFFTEDRIKYMCEKLIMFYFLLNQTDLDKWDGDPEEYANDDGGDSWKYDLRSCCETFFLTLLNAFRNEMSNELPTYILKAQQNPLNSSSQLQDILIKDAIYNMAGLAAFNLFDEIDFDKWLTEQLMVEVTLEGTNFRIIRRRVIWLISQWAGVRISNELRPQVYRICLYLMRPEEDMLIRLTAAKALMATMDYFSFQSKDFDEFLDPSFSMLMHLLRCAHECDTKLRVLSVMSFMVGLMQDSCARAASKLLTYLPSLWSEANDHNMLRVAILSTMVYIVKSLPEIPDDSMNFIYSLICMSTNCDDPSYVYLLEEGLELWLVIVENSGQLTTELLQLSTKLLTIIEGSTEYLRTGLSLIQSYILLNSTLYLNQYGNEVIKTCSGLLSDINDEGVVMVMKVFETCLRAEPSYGLQLLKPIYCDIFLRVQNTEISMEMSMYLAIISRVILIDRGLFMNIVNEMKSSNAFEKILNAYVNKMQVITRHEKRKLCALALTSLFSLQNNEIYSRMGGILKVITEVLNDIMSENNDGTMVDSLIFTNDSELDLNGLQVVDCFEYSSQHFKRSRDLFLKDPVHTIVLKDYLQSQLNSLYDLLGVEKYTNLMSSVESECLRNLSEFINLHIILNGTTTQTTTTTSSVITSNNTPNTIMNAINQ